MSGLCGANGSFNGGFGKIYKTSFFSILVPSGWGGETKEAGVPNLCTLYASFETLKTPDLLHHTPPNPPNIDPAVPSQTHNVVAASGTA